MTSFRTAAAATIVLLSAVGCRAGENYTTSDGLQELISKQSKPYVLVDVRTDAEWAEGHIPTAIHIPYQEIGGRLPTADRDALIVLILPQRRPGRSGGEDAERGRLHEHRELRRDRGVGGRGREALTLRRR